MIFCMPFYQLSNKILCSLAECVYTFERKRIHECSGRGGCWRIANGNRLINSHDNRYSTTNKSDSKKHYINVCMLKAIHCIVYLCMKFNATQPHTQHTTMPICLNEIYTLVEFNFFFFILSPKGSSL